MKKKIIIIILGAVLCGSGITMIFQRYQSWTDQAFEELISQSLDAYSDSQNTEVISKVEEVKTAMKMVAEMIRQVEESGADTQQYEKYFEGVSQNKDIPVQSIAYHRFDELDYGQINEEEEELLEMLKKGESVISDIYPSARESDSSMYYAVAEPVIVNGESIGFIRGLISSDTLLNSSQRGLLTDYMESFLIHEDGRNAFQDYLPSDEQPNMLDILSEESHNPKELDRIRKNIKKKEQEVIRIETKDEKSYYISYSFLPYKNWIILNVCSSEYADKYVVTLENNGKRFTWLLVGLTAAIIMLVLSIFYYSSRERRFERRRTDKFINFGDTLLCEYDNRQDILRCTSNTSKLLKIDETELGHFKEYVEETELVYTEDRPVLEELLEKHPHEGSVYKYELRMKGRDEDYIWCRVDVISTGGRKEDRLLLKITDISGEKEKEQGLMQKAQHDTLTDLLNREAFEKQVETSLNENQEGYLFMVDLDNFKYVNDVYGHAAGDETIRRVGSVLRKCFRSEDSVGRYGGDEFYAFMLGCIPEEVVSKRAARLIELVGEIKIENLEELHLTCSIGVVKCPEGSRFADCLKKADDIMYEVKRQGKNSWIIQ